MTEKILTMAFVGLLVFAAAVLLALPGGWVVMLALGAAHDTWAHVPPLSFWTCVVLIAAWRVVWPFSSHNEVKK